MSKRKKIIKNVLSIGLVCTLSIIGSTKISNANESAEQQLKTILQNYGVEKVNIEDGISLHIGETKDLSNNPNWKLSTEGIVSLSKDGQLKAIGSGTVFLSQKINNKIHVMEIYVPKVERKAHKYYVEPGSPQRDYYKVFVDAGHGGHDSGAPGFGKNESQVSLEIAKKVEQKLKEKNIHVKMSRETDKYLELKERAELANDYRPDAFVSIHLNSADIESAHGTETYCHPDKLMYKPLAMEIQNHAIAQTGSRDRGVKTSNLAVLRETNMPSALFETGFISNKAEYNKLTDPSYQDKLAIGVANGVEQYLKNTVQLAPLPVIDTGKVINTDALNVRGGYGTSYPIIGQVLKDTEVEIVEKNENNWYKIKYDGGYGFVSGKYIEIKKTQEPEVPKEPEKPEEPEVPKEPEVPNQVIKDIDGHWAKDQILDFISKGYISGYPEDNTFRPENSITRAEFVKIVNKVFDFKEAGAQDFTDVSKDKWYYNEISIGVKAGYIKGYETGEFKPENPITREEACVAISRIMNLQGDGKLEFKDNEQISSWAKDAVDALNDNEIIKGKPENMFAPKANINRAESVTILSRAENK